MTVIVECAGPFQWRPGYHRGAAMHRIWWGWFAIAKLRIPFDEFTTTSYRWVDAR